MKLRKPISLLFLLATFLLFIFAFMNTKGNVSDDPNYKTVKIENMESKYGDPRTVEILYPANAEIGESFPVLYMWDGQNIFHEFKGWGGEINKGWQVDETIDSLNKAGLLPRMIVVGIFNTNNRMADYMPEKPRELVNERIRTTEHEWYQSFKTEGPNSDNQLKFLVEELKPYIDENFQTKPQKENTFIAGASFGGLISLYAICEYPEVFGGAACLSTHWPPLNGVFLEHMKDHLPNPSDHKIYFDHGTITLDSIYGPYQKIADSLMLKNGYEHDKNWITKVYEGEAHNEKAWRERFQVPLEFLISRRNE